ncbi:hypothetical protein B5M09_002944 [Aphanomyces astaci]|uniref:Uncharacterized protein n=1 Tax=Aphanomyces astaci TaxID=112090 RepID=A0A425DB53_APHAT|nr:hypothetical protein B5M09_002944 [Aphanomyces astaci]
MLVPQDLVDVVKLATEVLGGVGAQQEYLGAPVVSGFDSMPSAWDTYDVVAGNTLCGVGKGNLQTGRCFRSFRLKGRVAQRGAFAPTACGVDHARSIPYQSHDSYRLFTRSYTPRYASKSSSAAWEVAIMWTFVLPATHRVSIHRVCEVAALDFRSCAMPKPCTYIGQFSRFVGLIAAAVAMTMLCYPFERL